MKLKNKKTGEILETVRSAMVNKDKFRIYDEYTDKYYTYNSLAELNEEWEDVPEEPKNPYFINWFGEVSELLGHISDREIEKLKEAGNYFETREEAEKAVEKLKAWKRLKDNGFRFIGLGNDRYGVKDIKYRIDPLTGFEENEDLHLLFGGEE